MKKFSPPSMARSTLPLNFAITPSSQPNQSLRLIVDTDRPTIHRLVGVLLDGPPANGASSPTSHRGPGRPPGPAGGSAKHGSEADRVRPKRGSTEFVCGWCSNHVTGRPGQKFCSTRCAAKSGLQVQTQRRSNGNAAPEQRPAEQRKEQRYGEGERNRSHKRR